jgi:hypothetical protein
MAEPEIVEYQISEEAIMLVAKVQEVVAEAGLSAPDAVMAIGELFAWVHILCFMSLGKKRVLAQMDRSAAASREWAEISFDGFAARAGVVEALNGGESGGRLQ